MRAPGCTARKGEVCGWGGQGLALPLGPAHVSCTHVWCSLLLRCLTSHGFPVRQVQNSGFHGIFWSQLLVKAFGSWCPGVAFPCELGRVHCARGLCCFCEVERGPVSGAVCVGQRLSPAGGCSLEVALQPCGSASTSLPLSAGPGPMRCEQDVLLEAEVSVGGQGHYSALTGRCACPALKNSPVLWLRRFCHATSRCTLGHKAGNLSLGGNIDTRELQAQ